VGKSENVETTENVEDLLNMLGRSGKSCGHRENVGDILEKLRSEPGGGKGTRWGMGASRGPTYPILCCPILSYPNLPGQSPSLTTNPNEKYSQRILIANI